MAPVNKVRVELKYPNVAVDQFGNQGTWTMVYNQGFEVVLCSTPSVPQPVVQSRRRPLLGPSPG